MESQKNCRASKQHREEPKKSPKRAWKSSKEITIIKVAGRLQKSPNGLADR